MTEDQYWAVVCKKQSDIASEHRVHCPACGVQYAPRPEGKHPNKAPLAARLKLRTRGHLHPKNHPNRQYWVWICSNCNTSMGNFTLPQWANLLKDVGDPRADNVRALLDKLRADEDILYHAPYHVVERWHMADSEAERKRREEEEDDARRRRQREKDEWDRSLINPLNPLSPFSPLSPLSPSNPMNPANPISPFFPN